MVEPVPIKLEASSTLMPRGHGAPTEARLTKFGPAWLPDQGLWNELAGWWLADSRGNTPNWDLAVGCTIEASPGLILVEAKAHVSELSSRGKRLGKNPSVGSRRNHERIVAAIAEAESGLNDAGAHVRISCDSHYQLANRLAFTWKLGMLGIPTVLVYLGFTGDAGISNVGTPFKTRRDWTRAFSNHIRAHLPVELLDCRVETSGAPIWILSRQRAVLEDSPPRL